MTNNENSSLNTLENNKDNVDFSLIAINDDGKVDGRGLWKFLESNRQFSDWINQQIDYGFADEIDFDIFIKTIGISKSAEYSLTPEMAEHLCMMSKSEKGMQARKFYIDCRKKLSNQLTPNIYQNIDFKKELQLIQDKLRTINSYVQSSWISDEEKMILLDEIKITSGLAYTTVKEHEKEIRKTLDYMKDGSIKIGNCMYSYKLSTANIFNAIKAKEILKRSGYDLEDLYTTQTRKKIVRTFID